METGTGNGDSADKQRLRRNIVVSATILVIAISIAGVALSRDSRDRQIRDAWSAAIREYNAGNYEEAVRLYRLAAGQGDPAGEVSLAAAWRAEQSPVLRGNRICPLAGTCRQQRRTAHFLRFVRAQARL